MPELISIQLVRGRGQHHTSAVFVSVHLDLGKMFLVASVLQDLQRLAAAQVRQELARMLVEKMQAQLKVVLVAVVPK